MYLTAQRIQRIKDGKVGINAFLHQHGEHDLPGNMQFDEGDSIDQIINQYPGKLIAESVDLVPGGNRVLSFVDIVGMEDTDRERIQNFLDIVERNIEGIEAPITESAPDLSVRFGITLGLQGNEVREYKTLTEQAMHLFESRNPPKWRSEAPWIEIACDISDQESVFSLSPEAAKNFKQMHGKSWVSKRISVDHGTKIVFESMYGDLIRNIAPLLTDLTLEQIAEQGGLILHDRLSKKKVKWPELMEIKTR